MQNCELPLKKPRGLAARFLLLAKRRMSHHGGAIYLGALLRWSRALGFYFTRRNEEAKRSICF